MHNRKNLQATHYIFQKDFIMTQLELDLIEVAKEASPESYDSTLGKAIAYWRGGRNIPLTLATELMADGYDVGALEARYMKV